MNIQFMTEKPKSKIEESTTNSIDEVNTTSISNTTIGYSVENTSISTNDLYIDLPSQCGISSVKKLDSKIVNGVNSTLHSWPWIAALGYKVILHLFLILFTRD